MRARFDPECMGADAVCLDNGSVLLDAQVTAVGRRRRSEEGLVAQRRGRDSPLLPAPAAVAEAVSAEAARSWSEVEDRSRVRVFATPENGDTHAILCRADRAVRWPNTYVRAVSARSSLDDFCCWTAKRDAKGWVVIFG